MGEVYEYHATHWLTDPGSLQFFIDRECFGDNQTPSSMSLTRLTDSQNLHVDCFLPQGGPHIAHRQRLPGPLPSGTKQLQRLPPPPEPPPRRASSSSDRHSYVSDNDGPRSNGSWEDNSFYQNYTHSYGNCDSDYDSISIE